MRLIFGLRVIVIVYSKRVTPTRNQFSGDIDSRMTAGVHQRITSEQIGCRSPSSIEKQRNLNAKINKLYNREIDKQRERYREMNNKKKGDNEQNKIIKNEKEKIFPCRWSRKAAIFSTYRAQVATLHGVRKRAAHVELKLCVRLRFRNRQKPGQRTVVPWVRSNEQGMGMTEEKEKKEKERTKNEKQKTKKALDWRT